MTARIVPKDLAEGYEDGWPETTKVGLFLASVREGNTATVASLTSGLLPSDVGRWSTQGAALLAKARGNLLWVPTKRRPFAAFTIELARAEAENESSMVAVVREVALADVKDSWRAAAWLLDHQTKAAPPTAEDFDDSDELDAMSAPSRDAED